MAVAAFLLCSSGRAAAQEAQDQEPQTRAGQIEQEQRDKQVHEYKPGAAEFWLDQAEGILTTGMKWHPFFDSAYSGGGFTLGAGYRYPLSAYSNVDLRGSITFSGYKRLEAEYFAPRLFHRRAWLSVIGGWREATSVGFYGLGMDTSQDDRVNYSFKQPYAVARFELRPTRRLLVIRAGGDVSQWKTGSGSDAPSIETGYTPSTLPGLGAQPTYIHSELGVALDSRPAVDYARRGSYIGAMVHDYTDRDEQFGFQQTDWEAIQHIPILRETWVISLHGLVQTTATKDDQQVPYFMMPSIGSGSTLRAYSSWRFRDRNSLLLQAEWRAMVNRFLDLAIFYDTGKVTAHARDLSLDGLKSDVGFGLRFHGPIATPLRVEFAKGSEGGIHIVFAASAAF
jgi:hypothetical protein